MTQIRNWIIDEEDENFGVQAISLVELPAIEENFLFFGKTQYVFAKADEEKRMLIGPAMIPNKQIYRIDKETGQEYYGTFTKETIKRAAELFLKNNAHHNYTYEHESDQGGLSLFESWIVDNPKMDKALHYGFEPKEGWWMVTLKVESDELWNKIKSGEIKGFSIEGYFSENAKLSQEPTKADEFIKILDNFLDNLDEAKSSE